MQAELIFLGTGTSMGVPTLGCDCEVCTSSDPRNRRLRPSVMVRWPGHTVVVDTGPDFREQALRERIRDVDAVLYTHSHADHILGLDDLRPLTFLYFKKHADNMPLYADESTCQILEKIYDYTFSPNATYPTRAKAALHRLGAAVSVGGVEFLHVPVLHGRLQVAGFRVGAAAYLTDMSSIPEESLRMLEGLEVLVIDALRPEPHPSHSNIEQSIAWAKRIGARTTYFTHMSHEILHARVEQQLPAGIHLAWDGLRVNFTI